MGEIKIPQKVKLITGIIFSDFYPLSVIHNRLEEKWGKIDLESVVVPFNQTDYYTPEMGTNLRRQFLSFENLIAPHDIVSIKLVVNELEKTFSELDKETKRYRRRVNIDPGYIELSKLVLASTKNYAHRIYLNNGIYAEITLRYRNKTFQPLDWTYPDYRTELAINFFINVRKKYQQQLTTKSHPLA